MDRECGARLRNAQRALGPLKRPESARDQSFAVACSERWEEAAVGFRGQRLHAVQIGLGTFSTIVQNLAGERDEWDPVIAWVLKASTEARPNHFRGVAVEPVAEHIDRLRKEADRLPHVRLVQAAISDEEVAQEDIHVLTEAAFEALLQSVSPDKRKGLGNDLTYLRNMSSIGEEHPMYASCRRKALNNYGVDVKLQSLRTQVWTYGRLAKELDFCGCEVLLIDAEGYDAKILRSMIEHCCDQEACGRMAWPDVIVFESAGLCDQKEGSISERDIKSQLEGHGYLTLLVSTMNTDMVRQDALERSPRLQRWAEGIYCHKCQNTQSWPLTLEAGLIYCRDCYQRRWPGFKGWP